MILKRKVKNVFIFIFENKWKNAIKTHKLQCKTINSWFMSHVLKLVFAQTLETVN